MNDELTMIFTKEFIVDEIQDKSWRNPLGINNKSDEKFPQDPNSR